MQDWNVVVSIREGCYKRARKLLGRFGRVDRTGYYNVLALRVEDAPAFLDALRRATEDDPSLGHCLARVIPIERSFSFQSAEEFETRARETVAQFLPGIRAASFHVRMHRRGFRGQLASQTEEQMLDAFLLDRLAQNGASGEIRFTDPDAVIAVETLGQWAGLSLCTRDDRARYPFVRVD